MTGFLSVVWSCCWQVERRRRGFCSNLPGGATGRPVSRWPDGRRRLLHRRGALHTDYGNLSFQQTYGAITTAGSSAGGNSGGSNYAYLNDQVTVQGFTRVIGDFGISVYGATTIALIQPTVVMNKIIKT